MHQRFILKVGLRFERRKVLLSLSLCGLHDVLFDENQTQFHVKGNRLRICRDSKA